MNTTTIRTRLEKKGWKITRVMNSNNLVATKNGNTVTAASFHELYRKIN